MDLLTMYPAKLGSPQTILAADITADATAMVVSDASVLPGAPNIAVIGSDENCEIISYSAIDSSTNTVTISARGLGDSTAKAWTSGTTVARNHSSLDHNTLMANIASLNTGKAEASHNHDDRYYTESEVNSLLAGKQNALILPLQTNLGGTGQAGVDTTPTADSLKMVTSGGVKTALDGKVSKSGDTMTGNLVIKNPNIDSTLNATSDSIKGIRFLDKNNVQLASVYGGVTTGDRTILGLRTTLNNISNSFYLLVKRDGTRQVIFDDPDSWKTGLGIWPTSLGGTGGNDSGWVTISNETVFKDSHKYVQFRRIGCFVFMRTVGLLLKDNLTAQTIDIFSVPDQFLPPSVIYCANSWTTKTGSFILVDPGSGKKYIRFNKGINASWPNTEYIVFSIMYLAN